METANVYKSEVGYAWWETQIKCSYYSCASGIPKAPLGNPKPGEAETKKREARIQREPLEFLIKISHPNSPPFFLIAEIPPQKNVSSVTFSFSTS